MPQRDDLTIAGFVAARKAKKAKRSNVIGIVLWCTLMPGLALLTVTGAHRLANPKPQVLIEGNFAVARKNSIKDAKRWDLWAESARAAADKWKEALGVNRFEFKLIDDTDACGPNALACADRVNQIIYVSSDGWDVDRTTIMMHEVGHLLGVAHIEGDHLMDKTYSGRADKPTDGAIALAKVAQASKLTPFWYEK